MKILLVKSFSRLTSVGNLAKELRKNGHEVHVLIPWDHPDVELMRNLDITVHVFEFYYPRKLYTPGDWWRRTVSLVKMVRLFRSHAFDIIHLNLATARLWGRLASLFAPKSIVISSIRGFEVRYERWTNWIDTRTVAVSSAVRSHMVASGLPPSKVVTILNGVSPEEMDTVRTPPDYLHQELGLDPTTRLVGMVAYFRQPATKGHKIFFDAVKLLHRTFPDVRFVLVGSSLSRTGHTREFFEDYVRRIGIEKSVLFLGERDDVPSLMRSFYAHVLPSLSEGCPMAVLEAMALSIPNVVSRIKCIEEIVSHEKTGLFFEPGDHRGLAVQIERLLRDPDLARNLASAGRRQVESEFSSAIMAGKYERLFQNLLEERTKTSSLIRRTPSTVESP